MSTTSSSPRCAHRWSDRLKERYQCEFSEELCEWWDEEIWRQTGTSEYREPVAPASLLEPAPPVIWPGLMACDLIPMISNQSGDWLCVRVGADNRAAEIVQWYHGGGDWIPWGGSLSEALVLDWLIDRLPGPSVRHAIPAETTRLSPAAAGPAGDALLRWALQRLPASITALGEPSLGGDVIAETLLEENVAEVAVRCELAVAALFPPYRTELEKLRHGKESPRAEEFIEWCFDARRIPEPIRRQLQATLETPIETLQDWDSVAQHAQRVTEVAPELAWAWDLRGYGCERDGDPIAALKAYRQGAHCSVFTDQSIRLRTHWTDEEAAKFSVARMNALASEEVEQSPYLQALCDQDAHRRRQAVTSYWTQRAREASEQGDHEQAYRHSIAAGWDLGADSIESYAEALERVSVNAARSGQVARAELARIHRACLSERYGA